MLVVIIVELVLLGLGMIWIIGGGIRDFVLEKRTGELRYGNPDRAGIRAWIGGFLPFLILVITIIGIAFSD